MEEGRVNVVQSPSPFWTRVDFFGFPVYLWPVILIQSSWISFRVRTRWSLGSINGKGWGSSWPTLCGIRHDLLRHLPVSWSGGDTISEYPFFFWLVVPCFSLFLSEKDLGICFRLLFTGCSSFAVCFLHCDKMSCWRLELNPELVCAFCCLHLLIYTSPTAVPLNAALHVLFFSGSFSLSFFSLDICWWCRDFFTLDLCLYKDSFAHDSSVVLFPLMSLNILVSWFSSIVVTTKSETQHAHQFYRVTVFFLIIALPF